MNKQRAFWLLVVFLFVFCIDYLSKALAVFFIPPMQYGEYQFGGIPVFKNFLGIDFSLNLVTNHGAAWGLFSHFSRSLLFLRICVVVAIICYVVFSKKAVSIHFPLTLVIAGAFGNVIDSFVYGHVIDMFHFVLWGYDFPVFNIADSAIFCGVMWMIIHSFFNSKSHASAKN